MKHYYLEGMKRKLKANLKDYAIVGYELRNEKKYYGFIRKIYQFSSNLGIEKYIEEMYDEWLRKPFNDDFYIKHMIIRHDTKITLHYYITVRFIIYESDKKIVPVFYF